MNNISTSQKIRAHISQKIHWAFNSFYNDTLCSTSEKNFYHKILDLRGNTPEIQEQWLKAVYDTYNTLYDKTLTLTGVEKQKFSAGANQLFLILYKYAEKGENELD